MKKKWKAAIYLRLSKDDGAKGESSSIKNQREIIKDFLAKNRDIKFVSERVDDGVSGVSFDRPAFSSMIQDVRDGAIDCIIVKDLSRFGRDHLEAGDYIKNIFPTLGVRFIAVNDSVDTINKKTDMDNILVPIKNIMNSHYSRDVSIKSKNALDMKRKKGDFVGAFAVYGYKKSEENRNKLVIDEKVADNVREMFRLKLSGMSADKIAEYLNEQGVMPPAEYKKACGVNYSLNLNSTDKPKWHATTVIRMLKNPVYIGVLVQGKEEKINFKVKKRIKKDKKDWVVFENAHEPIVESSMYETVQRALYLDTRIAPHQKSIHLFSGLIYCGNCGANVKRKTITANNKKYVYYSCINCKSHSLKENLLIESVTQTVITFISLWVEMENFILHLENKDFLSIKMKKNEIRSQGLMEELENTQRYKLSLYEKFTDKKIERNDFDNFYRKFNDKEQKIRNDLDKIAKEVESFKNNDDNISIYMKSFKKYKNLQELSRSVVIELIEEVKIFRNKEIEVKFRYRNELDDVMMLADLKNEVVDNG